MFRIIPYRDIDRLRWEALSEDGSIFSQGWFLDFFCTWDLLIYGDYEGGMPLPVRHRFGFSEVYQPGFIQKSEWCGFLPAEFAQPIFHILRKKYDHIHFNCNLKLPEIYAERRNYFLPLDRDPLEVQSGYNSNVRRNLKKQKHYPLAMKLSGDLKHTLHLYRTVYGSRNPHLKEKDYENMVQAYKKTADRNVIQNYHVLQDREMVSGLLLYIYNRRIHYILGAQTERGRKLNAMTMAFDQIITDEQNRGMILDFEGSNIEGVARFYQSFGSELSYFYEYKWVSNPVLKLLLRLKKLFGKV